MRTLYTLFGAIGFAVSVALVRQSPEPVMGEPLPGLGILAVLGIIASLAQIIQQVIAEIHE